MPGVVEQDLSPKLALGRPFSGSSRGGFPARRSPGSVLLPGLTSFALDMLIVASIGVGVLLALSPPSVAGSSNVLLFVVTASGLTSLGLWERGMYSSSAMFATGLHLRQLVTAWLQAVGLSALVIICLLAFSGHSSATPVASQLGPLFGGAWLPVFVLSGIVGLTAVRVVLRRTMRRVPPRRAVAVGATAICQQILERLDRDGHGGLDVVGIVEHDGLLRTDALASLRSFYGRTVLGGLPALMDLVRRDAIDTVIVALPWSAEAAIRDIVQALAASPVDIYVAPALDGVSFSGRSARTVGGIPMLQAGQRPLQGWRAVVKRIEDIVAASAMLALAGPALLTIAVAVKLSSKGPVLFRQRRVGFNNQIFEVYKFRTMYTHLTDADAQQQTRKGDPRITRVGAILRKTSLDELPQILNVLKGDMSLVGPRPHALQTRACGRRLEEVSPDYPARHRVKPGITGWAQVNGYRGELDTFDKVINRVNHDLYYIDNWSLSFDLRILWQTARLMISDNNAY